MHPFIILKRVNVVFEAFRALRGQLRRPQMFLEFYHTCFRILPHAFRILPHTLQRACPLQRPRPHTPQPHSAPPLLIAPSPNLPRNSTPNPPPPVHHLPPIPIPTPFHRPLVPNSNPSEAFSCLFAPRHPHSKVLPATPNCL